MSYRPQYYTVVSGVGESEFPLSSFDNALIQAGIADYNLVKVSSILPVGCEFCETIPLGKGQILYAAYASITVGYGQNGETAVAVAIPKSNEESGVIFEHSFIDQEGSAVRIVENMCIEGMNYRSRSIDRIISSSKQIIGKKDKYITSISAVVMW